jgi:hypothetical protein
LTLHFDKLSVLSVPKDAALYPPSWTADFDVAGQVNSIPISFSSPFFLKGDRIDPPFPSLYV